MEFYKKYRKTAKSKKDEIIIEAVHSMLATHLATLLETAANSC